MYSKQPPLLDRPRRGRSWWGVSALLLGLALLAGVVLLWARVPPPVSPQPPGGTPALSPAPPPAPTATPPTISPTADPAAPAAAPGAVFRWRAAAAPDTLDPALLQDPLAVTIGQNLYDGLTQYDPRTLAVTPALATRWDISPDGITYTFHLRPEARFANGDPVTASDFVYAWNRVLTDRQAPDLFLLEDIQGAAAAESGAAGTAVGIAIVDAHTLRVSLVRADAAFLAKTALAPFYVLNSAVVGRCLDDASDCFTVPGRQYGAGTGAYILDRWDRAGIRLRVNPHYWGQTAAVDVEIPIVADPAVARDQYAHGALDALDDLDPAGVDAARGDPALRGQLHTAGQARTVWIGLNTAKAPFGPLDDPKATALRGALALAVDRVPLITGALGGAGRPLTTLLPPGTPGFAPFVAYPFDPARAAALLAAAGYPGCRGLDLTYTTRARDPELRVAAVLAAQLQATLGCAVKVKSVPWQSFLPARQAGQYTLFAGAWTADYPDPQDWLAVLFHSGQIGSSGPSGSNDSGYRSAAYDWLIDRAGVIADPARRAERDRLYGLAEQLLLRDAALIPLYQPVRTWLVRPGWGGYGANSMFIAPFRLVTPAR